MKKLLIAIMAIGISLSAIAENRLTGPVPAEIISVIDGDTIKVRAMMWLDQSIEVSVRIRGIDAPELHQPNCGSEEFFAGVVKERLTDLLQKKPVTLYRIEHDKYAGRIVADIFTKDGIDIGKYLLEHGFAKPWGGKSEKPNWC